MHGNRIPIVHKTVIPDFSSLTHLTSPIDIQMFLKDLPCEVVLSKTPSFNYNINDTTKTPTEINWQKYSSDFLHSLVSPQTPDLLQTSILPIPQPTVISIPQPTADSSPQKKIILKLGISNQSFTEHAQLSAEQKKKKKKRKHSLDSTSEKRPKIHENI